MVYPRQDWAKDASIGDEKACRFPLRKSQRVMRVLWTLGARICHREDSFYLVPLLIVRLHSDVQILRHSVV